MSVHSDVAGGVRGARRWLHDGFGMSDYPFGWVWRTSSGRGLGRLSRASHRTCSAVWPGQPAPLGPFKGARAPGAGILGCAGARRARLCGCVTGFLGGESAPRLSAPGAARCWSVPGAAISLPERLGRRPFGFVDVR
jgi:hypothetical protein